MTKAMPLTNVHAIYTACTSPTVYKPTLDTLIAWLIQWRKLATSKCYLFDIVFLGNVQSIQSWKHPHRGSPLHIACWLSIWLETCPVPFFFFSVSTKLFCLAACRLSVRESERACRWENDWRTIRSHFLCQLSLTGQFYCLVTSF